MECRNWDEMDRDCLSNIFGRIGVDDLAVAVPFVCQSWYRASLDPRCWRVLDFRSLDFMPWSNLTKKFVARYSSKAFSFTGFMRFAVSRSSGGVKELMLPLLLASLEDLEFASNECPRLKTLVLPNLMLKDEFRMPELVGNWKDLEQLEMESKPSSFTEMAEQISINCTKFVALKMHGAIKDEDARAFVKFMSRLKLLDLSKSYLPKEQLLAIIQGCKELERLTVRDCVGFEIDDDVMTRSSGIKTFEHEGSKLTNENWYDSDNDDDCDTRYLQIIC